MSTMTPRKLERGLKRNLMTSSFNPDTVSYPNTKMAKTLQNRAKRRPSRYQASMSRIGTPNHPTESFENPPSGLKDTRHTDRGKPQGVISDFRVIPPPNELNNNLTGKLVFYNNVQEAKFVNNEPDMANPRENYNQYHDSEELPLKSLLGLVDLNHLLAQYDPKDVDPSLLSSMFPFAGVCMSDTTRRENNKVFRQAKVFTMGEAISCENVWANSMRGDTLWIIVRPEEVAPSFKVSGRSVYRAAPNMKPGEKKYILQAYPVATRGGYPEPKVVYGLEDKNTLYKGHAYRIGISRCDSCPTEKQVNGMLYNASPDVALLPQCQLLIAGDATTA